MLIIVGRHTGFLVYLNCRLIGFNPDNLTYKLVMANSDLLKLDISRNPLGDE